MSGVCMYEYKKRAFKIWALWVFTGEAFLGKFERPFTHRNY